MADSRRDGILTVGCEPEAELVDALRAGGYRVEASASAPDAMIKVGVDSRIGYALLGRDAALGLLNSGERLEYHVRAMNALKEYDTVIAECPFEELDAAIAANARLLFGTAGAAIARYDEKAATMALVGLSWSEGDAALVGRLAGLSIAGLSAPVGAAERRAVLEAGIVEASTLSGISFGRMPADLCEAVESALGLGWFRCLALGFKGELVGAVWLLGKRGTEPPHHDLLRVFGAIASNAIERREAEARVAGLLRDKETLLREIHHRVKNNMNTAISILSLQARDCGDPAARAALDDAIGRLRSMCTLYDKLYRAENLRELSLARYLPDLAEDIVDLFPNRDSVELRTEVEDLRLGAKELPLLGIFVYELVSNAMKYAFPEGRRGSILVSAKREGPRLRVGVEDDGVGLPSELDPERSTGFGMRLIALLAEQLGAELQVGRSGGAKFVLEMEGPAEAGA